MEMKRSLKPCPFCGAAAHIWHWNYGTAIECSNYNPRTHQVQIEAETEEEAVEAWNRRENNE